MSRFMPTTETLVAAIAQPAPGQLVLSGSWTARAIGDIDPHLAALLLSDAVLDQSSGKPAAQPTIQIDGSQLISIDSIGIWVLQRRLQSFRDQGGVIQLSGWSPQYQKMWDIVSQQKHAALPVSVNSSFVEHIGEKAESVLQDSLALLSFVGEIAMTFARLLPHPQRWRWRPVLHNIQLAGFEALPIVGITSFLLGIVVAYQGADQLKHYGANIFVVELVGYSMLREFAPLITAIIIAGRSGSSYAAQIGTMVVTEEVDAMRTIGIVPIDLLVIPKVIALLIALPLLTIFADVIGVLGGMVMASLQLGVGFHEFAERFGTEIPLKTLLIGVGKAAMFSIAIAVIGCFQGFRTKGNADSVGRQTTRSVVQAIFVVIVLDALFSVIFNLLDL
ncbi:phospholipid/cholesterol/gamma-HCH transport system permease protein [Undibacterium sp. GrIS 1.8]|uniref:ABC transporter permease n=1 Tax=unclassified Undibacterium TaxID=2630295 RepID=UPI003396570D